jgi:hypothetical protein
MRKTTSTAKLFQREISGLKASEFTLYFPTFFALAPRAFCAAAIRARRAALIFRLPGETGRIYFARSIL